MRVDPTQHRQRPLLVHHLAADFALLDVWRLPVEAETPQDTFELFLRSFPLLREGGDKPAPSRATRFLMLVRAVLLRLFGVHDSARTHLPIPGCSEHSLRERMSHAERAQFELPIPENRPQFVPVYGTATERLYELSNPTVHALLHLAWVTEHASQRAYMAVYAKPRGRLGQAYMALISPFRHFVVYPAMMKMIARAWQQARAAHSPVTHAQPR